MDNKRTSDLRQELMNEPNIERYISENEEFFSTAAVPDLLLKLHGCSGLSKAELARKAGMSEVYVHQVFSGRRNPSRDRLLCLCIGMRASLEETQQVLKLAAYAQLYPRLKRDAVISHGLVHQRTLNEINEALFSADEKTLC